MNAAIGVGRLGVDPGLDHRIEAGEHEAEERAAAEPGPLGNEDGHEDHRNDCERHKGRESPDMPPRRMIAGAARVLASIPAK